MTPALHAQLAHLAVYGFAGLLAVWLTVMVALAAAVWRGAR